MDMWNLEGHKIEGKYHGVFFRGVVTTSRSDYGAKPGIMHFVELETPITVYGDRREMVLVKTGDEPEMSEFHVIE